MADDDMSETYDLFQQGREHLRKGMPAQATVSLEKAKRREPDKASIREALGLAYFRIERWDKAESEFRAMLDRRELAEWASVHTNLYGTPAAPLEAALRDGRDVLLDIDTQGAAQLRERYPEAVLIFIVAPSMGELEQRLRERRADSEGEIARRLERARHEVTLWRRYDYLIVNRDVKEAMEQLESIIQAERCRVARLALTFPDLEVPN